MEKEEEEDRREDDETKSKQTRTRVAKRKEKRYFMEGTSFNIGRTRSDDDDRVDDDIDWSPGFKDKLLSCKP